MGSIKGDLSVMSLPDVVIWLANRQRTGKLVVARANIHKQIYILNGSVTQSSSDDPRERLGQHLVNFGYVTEQQLEVAFATQTDTGVPLGRVLVMSSVIDEDRLLKVLNYKTRECLLDAFEWENGAFEFVTDDVRNLGLDAPTSTHLAEIHSEGTSRRAMWDEIRKLLPSHQTILDVSPSIPSTLNAFDRKLLDFARAGRTIGEIALEVRALDFHVFARLYDLGARNLVKARAPGVARPPPMPGYENVAPVAVVPAAREEMLAELRMRVESREFDAAVRLARQIMVRDPNNAEAQGVLRALESGNRSTPPASSIGTTAIPRLLLSREQLDEYLLTSKERYVLSRIDGARNLAQIIAVSPIQEAELLKIVETFVQRKFVTV